MSEQNSSGKTVAVGIGSAGSRILSHLSRESLLVDRYAYVSCDPGDFEVAGEGSRIRVATPVDQKLTPAMVRGLAIGSEREIRRALQGADVVFVVAGLGGATGSGLAPVVASIAQEEGATTVGIAVMPFEYEKKLKFYAGVSLRRLRAASRGVIVIDNDTILRSSPDDSTLTDVYSAANREAVKALAALFSKPTDSSVPVGMQKILGTVLRDGYSLLGVSSSDSPDKAEEALAGAVVSLGKIAETKEAEHAVVILAGGKSVSATDVGMVVKRLGSMIDSQTVDVEYGVSYSGGAQLQVSLLASGFKSTKYDSYDPLSSVFEGRAIDDEMDYCLTDGLARLQACD